jgi:hypothetical protein
MLLIDYIKNYYGDKRGNKASFLRDNPDILPQELNRWINAELKVNLETGEIYKPTSKKINLKKEAVAAMSSLVPEATIECNQISNDEESRVDNKINTPVQAISEVINRHFAVLSHTSEVFEYQTVFEELMNELLEKKLINLRVPKNSIAESNRLYIPRTDYYWYGGVVADRVAKMLGSLEVYLWRERLMTESEVIFLGTANNVVAGYFICERVCKLFKKMKNSYKKEQGTWGSRKDIEDTANQYLYRFALGIIPPAIFIYDEDSQLRLIEYAHGHYSYAMN